MSKIISTWLHHSFEMANPVFPGVSSYQGRALLHGLFNQEANVLELQDTLATAFSLKSERRAKDYTRVCF